MLYQRAGRDNSNIGEVGEEIATEHLISKGYRIIERNYKEKYGEIDIVALSSDRTLVFVEVKTLKVNNNSISNLMPEDHLTSSKMFKLKKICQMYANKFKNYSEEKNWQIDLIAIQIKGGEALLNHYVNIS